MNQLRRIILAAALIISATPAFAQAPAAVPALPDAERRTTYTITGTTCACAVNFALYGDGTDYQNWVEVFINGVRVNYNDASYGWTITSPSGTLSSLARPITNAVLTFNSVQTGTVQIVGARRPRRVAQFAENRGVAARDLNQALTDIIAQNRENWDKTNDITGRSLLAPAGETLNLLSAASSRANYLLGFDNSGNTALYAQPPGSVLLAASIPGVAIEANGGGCSIPDNTSALLTAANSVSGAVRVMFTQNCTYNFNQTNAINFTKPVLLQGVGPAAAVLNYSPTGNGVFLNWSNGLNVIYAAGGAGISNISIKSADTTYTKTLVSFTDLSGFSATNSSIGWPNGAITGGTGSVCIYTHGRETAAFRGLTLQCDTPIELGMNPHAYQSIDHFHFHDLYLLPSAGFPNIAVDPGVVPTDVTFDGYQAWVGGTYGFYMPGGEAVDFVSSIGAAGSGYVAGTPVTLTGGTCSTPIQILPLTVNGSGGITSASVYNPGVCSVTPSNPVSASSGGATFNLSLVAPYRLSFANVRSEQGSSNSAYTFYISPAAKLQGLSIVNSSMDSFRCGTFLKNTVYATIATSAYLFVSGGCNSAVNATSANGNDMLTYANDYWLSGVTQTVTGMTAVGYSDFATGSSATVPSNALYSSTISHYKFNYVDVANDVASTTFNNVGITKPASTATFALGSGKSVAINNSLTFAGSDSATLTFQGTDTYVGRATTDTLTNKTITCANNTCNVRINADVSGLGTGVSSALTNTANTVGGVASTVTQTPTIVDGSGASLSLTVTQEGYQVGNMVHQLVSVTYPTTASGATAQLNGLAVTVPNRASAAQCFVTRSTAGFSMFIQPVINTKNLLMFTAGGAVVTNTNLSTFTFSFECIYPAT